MKKVLSLMLCVLMLASCLALCAYANEETTAETTEEGAAPVERTNDRMLFDVDLTTKPNPIGGNNGLNKSSGISKKGEWEGYKINIKYPEDPNFTIFYSNYFKKYNLTPLTGEEAAFIVLRFAGPEDGYYDDFEIYHSIRWLPLHPPWERLHHLRSDRFQSHHSSRLRDLQI